MHGLYLLWWVQERQLSPALVATVLAAGDITLMLLEVPTGRFADRFGHRASLILGSAVQVAAMVCCWLGRGAPELIVASVLVAIGDAFRSGADHALLYRTCVALGREGEFQAIEARTRTGELVALVGLTIAGGAIATTWSFAVAWLAEIALCAIGLAIACAMVEPPAEASDDFRNASCRHAPIVSGALALLIVPASLLGATAGAAAFFAQTSGTNAAGEIALLVAVITLFEAAGSAAAARLPAGDARDQVILASLGAVLFGIGFGFPSLFPVSVCAQYFLLGLAEPLRAAAIQRAVADDVRARAASLSSACDMAFLIVALPAAGVWQSRRRN
jgi:MFS family permease